MSTSIQERLARMRASGLVAAQAQAPVSAQEASALFDAPATQGASTAPVYTPTSTRAQALELLSKGLSTGETARALSCSPSLISQFLAEPEFKSQVTEGLALRSVARTVRDDKIDKLEDMALDRLAQVIGFGFSRPMEILKAVQVINGLHRRGVNSEGAVSEDTGRVVLELPKFAGSVEVALRYNTNNEVVEVNGREMRTMPSAVLGGLIQAPSSPDELKVQAQEAL